jgi:phospholipid/cholesterol/gamma-HCH transport system permease protein
MPSGGPSPRGFSVEPPSPGAHALRLTGDLTLAGGAALWAEVRKHTGAPKSGEALDFDLSGVRTLDGGAMALLVHLRDELVLRGVATEFVGAAKEVEPLVHLYHGDVAAKPLAPRTPEGALAQIGRATMDVVTEIRLVLGFFGDMVLAFLNLLKEPRTFNWREVVPLMDRMGTDAVPIVLLITFLVGFVMAFQGAVQLKQFGANIYVADLVGLSIARELGPLMTAIVVCGRSGAACAAEIGTMKVSEEIDALRTLGFGPMRFLVLPRVVALVLVLPILTLLADFVGIAGGVVVGIVSLDLSLTGYFIETRSALTLWDVGSGLVKSVVFALTIALIACQQGFATSGGAEGVGRRTTSAVVTILFSLIIIDAGFTVFFHAFHL